MDPTRFDRLVRTIATTGTRRTALGMVAAVSIGVGLAGPSRSTAQGCLPNGTSCQEGVECCSGRCEGQVCQQADSQGVCTLEWNVCGDASINCGTTRRGGCSGCFVTTEGHSFCGTRSRRTLKTCGCTSNRECERRLRKGAKCVVSDLGHCGCPEGTQSMCVKRCQNLFSAP